MYMPVQAMIWTPERRATSATNWMSRPRSAVVQSTMVFTPRAATSRSLAAALSISASRSQTEGKFSTTPGDLTSTCSCMRVKPSSPMSRGPATVLTTGMAMRSSLGG